MISNIRRYYQPTPCKSSPNQLGVIEQNFSVTFDMAAVELEHREFMLNTDIEPNDYGDVVAFWLAIARIRSPMGELKYSNLALLALKLLPIPSSNAD